MKVLRVFAALCAVLLLAACAAPVEPAVPEEPAEPPVILAYGESGGIVWREIDLFAEEHAETLAWLQQLQQKQRERSEAFGATDYAQMGFPFPINQTRRLSDTQLLIERQAEVWLLDETTGAETKLLTMYCWLSGGPLSFAYASVREILSERFFTVTGGHRWGGHPGNEIFDVERMSFVELASPMSMNRLQFIHDDTLYFLGLSTTQNVYAVHVDALAGEMPIQGEALLSVDFSDSGLSPGGVQFSPNARHMLARETKWCCCRTNLHAMHVFDLQAREFVARVEMNRQDTSARVHFIDNHTALVERYTWHDEPIATIITLP